MEKTSLEIEDNGYDKNGKKVNDNGGDTTDYMYDDKGNIISSTKVKVLETNHFGEDFEGYGFRVYNVKSGGLYDPSFDIFTSFVGGGVVKNTVGMGVRYVSNITGGLKQWIRIGTSFSVSGKFSTYGIRWGASPRYLNKIGSPILRNWNKSLRRTKLPGNSWRTKDSGHLHFWKK